MIADNEFYTTKQVCSLLNICRQTLYKYGRKYKKEITVVSLGGHNRYPKASLNAFIERRRKDLGVPSE